MASRRTCTPTSSRTTAPRRGPTTDAPAGLVNYRVSAEVDECNRSPAHQKNAVEVLDQAAEFVGSVAATSAAGAATITWSPADNATSQVVIAVNANDDTDFCLAVKDSIADNHTCSGLTAGAALRDPGDRAGRPGRLYPGLGNTHRVN